MRDAASVRFKMRTQHPPVEIIDAVATIVTAASGAVRYDWQAGDTDTADSYEAEWEITFANGWKATVPNRGYIAVEIGEDVG